MSSAPVVTPCDTGAASAGHIHYPIDVTTVHYSTALRKSISVFDLLDYRDTYLCKQILCRQDVFAMKRDVFADKMQSAPLHR